MGGRIPTTARTDAAHCSLRAGIGPPSNRPGTYPEEERSDQQTIEASQGSMIKKRAVVYRDPR
jgi:hypothetical protein